MREDGCTDIVALENKTVVTDHIRGAVQNKWIPILKKYDFDFIPLTDVEWVDYIPINKMLAMNIIFPDGFKIPKPLKYSPSSDTKNTWTYNYNRCYEKCVWRFIM